MIRQKKATHPPMMCAMSLLLKANLMATLAFIMMLSFGLTTFNMAVMRRKEPCLRREIQRNTTVFLRTEVVFEPQSTMHEVLKPSTPIKPEPDAPWGESRSDSSESSDEEPEVRFYSPSESGTHTPSPYEKRWPGIDLPRFAKKPPITLFNGKVPEGKRVCYVHVGKTGGSALGCSLGFRLHCNRTMRYPIGLLPRYTPSLLHADVNDCGKSTSYFLYSVRNPLRRVQSAYVYDRPASEKYARHGAEKLYIDCGFRHLNDFAERGLAEDGEASEECKARAHKAIRGEERYGSHLYFNYGFHVKESLGLYNRPVMVIRTEHQEEDWAAAEQVLGGEHVNVRLPKRNVVPWEPSDEHLSDRSRSLLCEALCEDILVYVDLLRRAVNLSENEVEQSLDELYESCPREYLDCMDDSK